MEEKKKVEIVVNSNGPYMVKGEFKVVDAQGNELRVTDPTYLCRCGHSRNKPYCDGQHRNVGWKE